VAVLYDALAELRGIGPREADELEIWECATLLGVGKAAADPRHSSAQRRARGVSLLAQRMANAHDPGFQPSVQPVDPRQLDAVRESLA
jgi:hypothetical protein